ncbi:MAG: phosphate propanoyltransferase [Romboutsia sp.]|uniref:phosphate propanoyltransferase n=1 Tax=Romboutsia sp. TaxID=1965302 RepID=UPI003F3FEE3B
MDLNNKNLVEIITKVVIQKLQEEEKEVLIPIGISNRHLHICEEDLHILFGKGYKLTKFKDLKQPNQFAANECVTIKGPKGEFQKVRILGPLRNETQVEISLSDGFKLGVNPPIKESGKLEESKGIELIGPKGKVVKEKGVIAALRHIHMSTITANKLNLSDKDFVDVEISGIRKAILGNVLVRVDESFELEMHLDMDEANSCCIKNNDLVKIVENR